MSSLPFLQGRKGVSDFQNIKKKKKIVSRDGERNTGGYINIQVHYCGPMANCEWSSRENGPTQQSVPLIIITQLSSILLLLLLAYSIDKRLTVGRTKKNLKRNKINLGIRNVSSEKKRKKKEEILIIYLMLFLFNIEMKLHWVNLDLH